MVVGARPKSKDLVNRRNVLIPDIEATKPLKRFSLTTKKPMKPILYVWWCCPCGEIHAAPLMARGTIKAGTCPFCGRRRS